MKSTGWRNGPLGGECARGGKPERNEGIDGAVSSAIGAALRQPHHADVGALCQAYGVPYRQLTTPAGLDAALATPKGGIEVAEAVVRRDNRPELDATIRALV